MVKGCGRAALDGRFFRPIFRQQARKPYARSGNLAAGETRDAQKDAAGLDPGTRWNAIARGRYDQVCGTIEARDTTSDAGEKRTPLRSNSIRRSKALERI